MRILWHSNAPWAPTGYGAQTGLFAPHVAAEHELAISAFYGLEGAPIRWNDIPVLPGLGGEYGNSSLPEHATRYFNGDPRGGVVFTLMDVWVISAQMAAGLNMACWVPVDHEPAPPAVLDFFARSNAIPVAMSRFGQEQLAGLNPLYLPHAVDTTVYRPIDKIKARAGSLPDDAFVVGMVAANKGRPSRKSFVQAFQAFARFAAEHENAYLYLHTTLDPSVAGGENLTALLRSLGIPTDRVRIADQYAQLFSPHSPENMALIYSSMDVLLNPAMGEGFGVPVLEAQACGVPVIVTDNTAMREVCGAGWRVSGQPYWTPQGSWQTTPDVGEIVDALEECHGLSTSLRQKLAVTARKHANGYDVHKVVRQHLRPALREIEVRFEHRDPVTIPAEQRQAA